MSYTPKEDSFLLKKWVAEKSRGEVLDVGTGKGIQAVAASKSAKSVLAVDIDQESINYCKNQFSDIENLKFVRSDLFSNVEGSFDLISFNPPYLPRSGHDRGVDLSGGDNGHELIQEFLLKAKDYLKEDGEILLVFSSKTGEDKILNFANKVGYRHRQLDKKHISFEDIFVFSFKLEN